MENNLPTCPVEITLSLKPDRWKVLIVRDLLNGSKRFGELKESITGIPKRTLTNCLRQMESVGIVNRKIYGEVPPRVEYSLTEVGQNIKPIIDSVTKWGNEYKKKQEQ